jgi:lipopolysaccharide biosynthesis glycosyltransferase
MINLLYGGNDKVFDGLMISLLSASKNTKDTIRAYVLTMDLSDVNEKYQPLTEQHRKYLEDMLKEQNPDSTVTLIDITDIYKSSMLNSKNLKNHFTPFAQLRLFADMIPEIPYKVIYLDTDTVVNGDLKELFKIDISNYELAAVKDLYNWLNPNRWKVKKYFNSGVLLLNMKEIRKTKLFKKSRELVANKKMISPDQDALNFLVKKKLMLPEKFNAKDKYYKEIIVHHFCNVRRKHHFFFRVKPWMVDLVKEKMDAYNELLDEYLERKKNFEEKYSKEK